MFSLTAVVKSNSVSLLSVNPTASGRLDAHPDARAGFVANSGDSRADGDSDGAAKRRPITDADGAADLEFEPGEVAEELRIAIRDLDDGAALPGGHLVKGDAAARGDTAVLARDRRAVGVKLGQAKVIVDALD